MIRMSFRTKFRILREKKGMPRTGCDEIFHLMHGTVSCWENGYQVPEEELLPDIASFFGITLRELLSAEPITC